MGVIIGRFQPFHKGHVWLIFEALKKFEKVIILIGSSNIDDKSNPWSLDLRRKMISEFIFREGIENGIIRTEDVIDVPDDNKWLEITLKKIGKKSFTVIGDNEWVNGIFEKANYKAWRPGYYNREKFQGIKIRELFANKKEWRDRVPKYLVSLVEKN